MLDATESNAKGNGKFAVDVDHVEKKCGRCKKKESNLFLFYATKPLVYKLPSLEIHYILKILTSNVDRTIYLNKGSSSLQAIYKCILHM